MDTLTTRLCGKNCEVWALASKHFPKSLMPKNTDGYLCFIGISPETLKTSYGHVHFIEFGHEPLSENEYEDDMGILDHMCLIYGEKVSRDMYECDENTVYVYPRSIDNDSVDYWVEVAESQWGVKDRNGLTSFIEDNELSGHVDWKALYDYLPKIYYPSERIYSESESESELEEGEIVTDDDSDDETETGTDYDTETESESDEQCELPPKRRKVVLYSESDEEET
jgi:hypothetical protein